MSTIAKCDSCGTLNDTSNPVETRYDDIDIRGKGLLITVDIPQRFQRSHLCKRCLDAIISARFAELCGLLAPYQPARVSGFIQGGASVEDAPMTKEERAALSVLSRRLLKA